MTAKKILEMEYRKSKIIGIMFFAIAGAFLISFILLTTYLLSNPIIKDVPCYDRAGNVIQGLICKEDENTSTALFLAIPFGLVIGIFFLLGSSFYGDPAY